jgi:ATP-dependent Clp protease ATP-binding subunit ClpA
MGHHWLDGEHLLLGLARQAERSPRDSVIRRIFDERGVTLERLRAEVANAQPRSDARVAVETMTFTAATKLIVELAIHEARYENVRPEHLLVALWTAGDASTYILRRLDVEEERVRALLRSAEHDR